MERNEIFKKIEAERDRQDRLHPEDLSDLGMLAVLIEEVGEIGKALQAPQETENLKEEILQTATVCVRWLEKKE